MYIRLLIIVGDFIPRNTCYLHSLLLILPLLFACRFPVIHFEHFCLAVNHLGS